MTETQNKDTINAEKDRVIAEKNRIIADRFKFRATVKGYFYNETPGGFKEAEPLIVLPDVDMLGCGIGVFEENLEEEIRKQYPDFQDDDIECIIEGFRDGSLSAEDYIILTPRTVEQCTGLKDKNGKLIYEGDLLLLDPDAPLALVVWEGDVAMFCLQQEDCCYTFDNCGYTPREMEIVGNIHENPELLGAEK